MRVGSGASGCEVKCMGKTCVNPWRKNLSQKCYCLHGAYKLCVSAGVGGVLPS